MEQGTVTNVTITTDLTKVNVRASATLYLTYKIGKTFFVFNMTMLVNKEFKYSNMVQIFLVLLAYPKIT